MRTIDQINVFFFSNTIRKKHPHDMRRIAVASGDGIGAEVMAATLKVFDAMKVPLQYEHVAMGGAIYKKGFSAGMTPEAQAAVEKCGVLFKGPMETPKGKGVKSINVTARKMWTAYANKRLFRSLPGIVTPFSQAGIPIDIVMVRENIEDTYGGIEHALTHDVTMCRRLISRSGSEKVHRYTFEMAKSQGRKKVTCGHKANIMKLTDGLFLETFYNVAKEFPDIQANDTIVDDMAMKLVAKPDTFDVIVLPNLQGDILSDLCAGLVGGLGFAPSASIGDNVSIFEAVHGTAPDIAGKGVANPCALMMSGCMMLRNLGLRPYARSMEIALIDTFKAGVRTRDFAKDAASAVSTDKFADEVISRLTPVDTKSAPGSSLPAPQPLAKSRMLSPAHAPKETLAGFDLFVEYRGTGAELAAQLQPLLPSNLQLTMISNRGTQVWPTGSVYTDCVDQYRVRVEAKAIEGKGTQPMTYDQLWAVMPAIGKVSRICTVESLLEFDGKAMYSKAQGQ